MKILLLGKKNKDICLKVKEFLEAQNINLTVCLGNKNDSLEEVEGWKGDYIFSFLSPWILNASFLNKAKKLSINWHPAPPEMPGYGGASFAIYEKKERFGFTTHKMISKVDSGPILDYGYFKVSKEDDVFSLSNRSYEMMFISLKRFLKKILEDKQINVKNKTWGTKKTTRKDLDLLCRISLDLSKGEIIKRISANTYGSKCWAYILVNNKKYNLFIKDESS